jgi:hypothetical protein
LAIACGLLVLFVLLFANQPADPADVAAAAQHTDRSSRATSAAPVLAGQREVGPVHGIVHGLVEEL